MDFYLLLIFIGGLPPFREIYVVVYKNEWRQVNQKSCEFKKGIQGWYMGIDMPCHSAKVTHEELTLLLLSLATATSFAHVSTHSITKYGST